MKLRVEVGLIVFRGDLQQIVKTGNKESLELRDLHDISQCSQVEEKHQVSHTVPSSSSDSLPPLVKPPSAALIAFGIMYFDLSCIWSK
jgi:hypothetical protein